MCAEAECTLVLASASPRRRRLITWLGLPVRITAVDVPEDLESELAWNPPALAEALATDKAVAAAAERAQGALPHGPDASEPSADELVLGFDTIVVLDGGVLGKPRDVPDAWRMLRALSGRTHQVVTGVSMMVPGERESRVFSVTTNVRMKQLSDCQIEAWMAMGEFMGCAGAYNIEGQVAEVELDECYQNVAGLPLCHLWATLARIGGDCRWPASLIRPVETCDVTLGRCCALGPRITSEAPGPTRLPGRAHPLGPSDTSG